LPYRLEPLLPGVPIEGGLAICRVGKVEGDRKIVRGLCKGYAVILSGGREEGMLDTLVIFVTADVRLVDSGEELSSMDATTDPSSKRLW
jgi:hypothetical protein